MQTIEELMITLTVLKIFVVFLLLAALPVIYISLGRYAFGLVTAAISKKWEMHSADLEDNRSSFLIFGLLLHCWLSLALRSSGLPWVLACFLPLIPFLYFFGRVIDELKAISKLFSIRYVFWFAIIISLGVTLFDSYNEIQTPWKNNYGDLAFHVGMITSFVFGNNTPPEFHLLAGETLFYPFLINFWTAMLWWIVPSFTFLAVLFCYQWTLLWSIIFVSFRRVPVLAWALLFGGGTYLSLNTFSWEMLGKGEPWTVFLTTIWVTQRAALFGAASTLCIITLIYEALEDSQGSKRIDSRMVLAGLILSLSPLVHAHFALVTGLYCLFLFIFKYFGTYLGKKSGEITELRGYLVKNCITFLLSVIPAITSLPWLLGKVSVIDFMAGWNVGGDKGLDLFLQIKNSLYMWGSNAPVWLALILLVWILGKHHAAFFAALSVFVLGNIVQIAVWDWDQLKIFLALYTITLASVGYLGTRRLVILIPVCLLLITPAVYESLRIFTSAEMYTVYSKDSLKKASQIRKITEPESVIVAKSDHNSLVTLSGRKLFVGFEGTLWSHGAVWDSRKPFVSDLQRLAGCREEHYDWACPDYLLWTGAEQRHFKQNTPGEGFQHTEIPYLYRLSKEK